MKKIRSVENEKKCLRAINLFKFISVVYLKPNASKCSSSSHIERLSTCRIRSKVSLERRICDAFRPRKNVLYSKADTMAIKSLRKNQKKEKTNHILSTKRFQYMRVTLISDLLWFQMIEIA